MSGLIKLGLFGSPIGSSLSPLIHRQFAQQCGIEIDYQLFETDTAGFPGQLEAFRLAGGTGCNVTLPLKADAWRLATDCSAVVSQAQAANTLVLQAANGWFAHSTDGDGLLTDLTINHAIGLAGQRLLILGAGGAVAGILGKLLAAAPAEIVLVNRNLERAHRLAARFADAGRVRVVAWQDLAEQGGFDLIINSTSLGHQGQAPGLLPDLFNPGSVCYDLNYFKASQPLKNLCEKIGKPYVDGLGMLVEQAAKSFSIWTGKVPETAPVIAYCRELASSES